MFCKLHGNICYAVINQDLPPRKLSLQIQKFTELTLHDDFLRSIDEIYDTLKSHQICQTDLYSKQSSYDNFIYKLTVVLALHLNNINLECTMCVCEEKNISIFDIIVYILASLGLVEAAILLKKNKRLFV